MNKNKKILAYAKDFNPTSNIFITHLGYIF